MAYSFIYTYTYLLGLFYTWMQSCYCFWISPGNWFLIRSKGDDDARSYNDWWTRCLAWEHESAAVVSGDYGVLLLLGSISTAHVGWIRWCGVKNTAPVYICVALDRASVGRLHWLLDLELQDASCDNNNISVALCVVSVWVGLLGSTLRGQQQQLG
jgi:hypothetical protein